MYIYIVCICNCRPQNITVTSHRFHFSFGQDLWSCLVSKQLTSWKKHIEIFKVYSVMSRFWTIQRRSPFIQLIPSFNFQVSTSKQTLRFHSENCIRMLVKISQSIDLWFPTTSLRVGHHKELRLHASRIQKYVWITRTHGLKNIGQLNL